jgi:recombination protein RecA
MIQVEGPQTLQEKDAAIAKAIADIEKELGKGSLIKLGDRVGVPFPHYPTGIYQVDYDLLGIGGLPKGRMIDMFGAESGGKSTLALTAVASAQKRGEACAYVDTEHALSPAWCQTLGVNLDQLLISQPDCAEDALRIVERLVETAAFSIIVVDSVAALVTKAELEGEIGDAHVGMLARLMSQAMRMLTAKVARSNTTIIWINQLREKIGISYGNPETTPGGRALKFYSSIRCDVRRVAAVKNSADEVIGNKVRIKIVKNKLAPPFKEAELDLLFDAGFDATLSLIDAAVEFKHIAKAGSWFTVDGQRFQGKDAVRTYLRQDEARIEALRKKLRGT